MFELKLLDTPETISEPGGTRVLTHECRVLKVDPRQADAAVKVTIMKGFLDASGAFQDFGEHVVTTMDKAGLDKLQTAPGGAKLADIAPAIEARRVEKKKAEDKRLADESAAKDAEAKAAKKAAKAATPTETTKEN
jgi:hypothetical protein